ncbi:probable serine/threonine-protein kinase PBL12 [Selaginella moellendorffii]|uniref:probable serine/threonine-protein kinase PBL12 n=1 Tax=Selaginella moellendorffii TaxID=88036 RepID=UPI000D1C28AD|nr:probable serine/threonine-protein kinase PBL12 [Selaginella moellendorffii]|eukprot:XP_002966625.2 probable serine/threonine-protein kinase PBL12 [Selaginella moellendorffii]
MGCLGFSRGSAKNRKNKKIKRGDEDASVWPMPAAAPPPDRSPNHARRSSSVRRPHPLPAPTDFSARGRSPPQPLPPVPSISSSWSARDSRLRRFEFERLARLCNHFAPRSQLRESVHRCFLEQEEIAVDVLVLHSCATSEEEWIEQLHRVTQLEHRNVCRIIGFSLANSRRLVVFEASETSAGLDELLLLPSASDHNRGGRVQRMDFNWDARLKIALAAAQGLAFLHQSSPFQASRFGPSNVLVDKIGKNKHEVKLQLLLSEESCDASKAGNVTAYGILLLELVSGKTNMARLILGGGRGGSQQGLFVKWARGVVNDSSKLGSILDPRLLHCNPLSAARDLANFALSCLHDDPRLRPRMPQAVSLLQSLIAMRDMQQSSKMTARTASSTSSSGSPSSAANPVHQHQQFLGRSATFSHHQAARRRDMTPPPPRMSTDLDQHDWRAHVPRSAGASPARYTTASYY